MLRRALLAIGPLVAVASMTASSACGSFELADDPDACAAYEPATCQESQKVFCNDEGRRVAIDCSALGMQCVVDRSGVGDCVAKPCDARERAKCDGTKLTFCSDGLLRTIDCGDVGETCAYSTADEAACTRPCPVDVDVQGRCDGELHLLRCDGGVLYDVDCSSYGMVCARDAFGTAYCGERCPEGMPQFGTCDGDKLTLCSGELLYEVDCAADGTTCGSVGRYGARCRGCVARSRECAGDVLHACLPNGTSMVRNCAATGGTCSDEKSCLGKCVHASTGRTCVAAQLAPGESRCAVNPHTGFVSIERCNSDGTVSEDECAAAADGSVECISDPEPHCVSKLGCAKDGRRCTDRGVLMECANPRVWRDCGYYGGTCTADADEAYCTCAQLTAEAVRCVDGERAVCTDGRLRFEACEC